LHRKEFLTQGRRGFTRKRERKSKREIRRYRKLPYNKNEYLFYGGVAGTPIRAFVFNSRFRVNPLRPCMKLFEVTQMNQFMNSLAAIFAELVNGTDKSEAFVLNRGDAGLLRSLDQLSAADASASSQGGATIAAHVNHLRYGLSLMNRWAAGENPFSDADWTQAWKTSSVSESEWSRLREQLRSETEHWHGALREDREMNQIELNGVIGSVAHLAYHLGAIRQIAPAMRGPKAND
jgi:hypothetical protein